MQGPNHSRQISATHARRIGIRSALRILKRPTSIGVDNGTGGRWWQDIGIHQLQM